MSESANPTVYVIAGPNGAGKTTFAEQYLSRYAKCDVFVNADLIAADLSPANPDSQALIAGRMMLERIDDLAQRRSTFSFETTPIEIMRFEDQELLIADDARFQMLNRTTPEMLP